MTLLWNADALLSLTKDRVHFDSVGPTEENAKNVQWHSWFMYSMPRSLLTARTERKRGLGWRRTTAGKELSESSECGGAFEVLQQHPRNMSRKHVEKGDKGSVAIVHWSRQLVHICCCRYSFRFKVLIHLHCDWLLTAINTRDEEERLAHKSAAVPVPNPCSKPCHSG